MYSKEFLERFWAKVDKREEGCWLWTAKSVAGCGYGTINHNGKQKYAHRVSLEIYLGREIIDGMIVAHAPVICHNIKCVNPAHLSEKTLADNSKDKIADNTLLYGETHPSSKLTDEIVRNIKGETGFLKDIAMKYNICYQTVWDIRTGRRWKHIK